MTQGGKSMGRGENTVITRLARWVLDFDMDAIPPEVITLMKHSFLDAMGCAFAARSAQAVQNILQTLDDLGGNEECTVIGAAEQTSIVNAVLANGVLIRALDFNDHLGMDPNDGSRLGGHPSDVMAVTLSVGEWKKKSGKEVLGATVMAYELFGRLQKFLHRDLPWDHVTALGLVAPAAAGRLLGLSEEQLAHALALSAAHSLTLGAVRRGQLSASKFLASPMVMKNGMLSTLFAARGVTGPLAVFEDSRGLIRALMTEMDPDILMQPVGKKYMMEGVAIKAYPAFDIAQAPIAAALKMREALTFPLEQVDRIELALNDHPMTRMLVADRSRQHPQESGNSRSQCAFPGGGSPAGWRAHTTAICRGAVA